MKIWGYKYKKSGMLLIVKIYSCNQLVNIVQRVIHKALDKKAKEDFTKQTHMNRSIPTHYNHKARERVSTWANQI